MIHFVGTNSPNCVFRIHVTLKVTRFGIIIIPHKISNEMALLIILHQILRWFRMSIFYQIRKDETDLAFCRHKDAFSAY